LTEEATSYLKRIQRERGKIRAAHLHACIRVMSRYVSDDMVDHYERERLSRLFEFLDVLGWAPGE
jgi:hypothetical protein